MRLVEKATGFASDDLERRGDFYWDVGKTGKRTLVLALPCRRSETSRMGEIGFSSTAWCYSRWTIDHKNSCGAQWSWNGNEEKPTLNPSLHAVGIYHGWIRDGMLIEC